MKKILQQSLPNSLIKSEDVTKSERVLGYFVGPCLAYMAYNGLAGTYLTQYYTDVLGVAGIILTWMPLISKIISSIVGLLIGRIIDRTKTAQGKARPWILFSGILLTVFGFLLYAVPRASYAFQIAWVVISYNLFFSLAFSTYSLSHAMMVPLSTRDTKQRDSLAMLSSMAISMLPGALTTVVMPLLVRQIGVGDAARGSWLTVMGILSVLAIPATLIEYFFTRERVTAQLAETAQDVSFSQQVKACFHNQYWLLVIGFTLILHFCNSMSQSSMIYYCNWVLGNSVESGATNQLMVNIIGQAPMGFGIVILWPLVRKFGKKKVTMIGFTIAALGSLMVLMAGNRMDFVLAGLLIRSTGSLPTYVMASYLAEVLDHVEEKHGIRADGFSASVNSMTQTIALGLCQTVLLAGISSLGYIPPESTMQVITQPDSIVSFFRFCFAVMPIIGYGGCAVLIGFYRLERPTANDGKLRRNVPNRESK
ncbi:MAG: MFS transporter [Faecousia sp.]